MIAQELVKAGFAYVGRDGEVRHVHCINRPGNGYCVQWDSLPRPRDTMAVLDWYETQQQRPHGMMQMRRFQKWAVDVYKSPAQEPGAQQGQSSAREGAERSEA